MGLNQRLNWVQVAGSNRFKCQIIKCKLKFKIRLILSIGHSWIRSCNKRILVKMNQVSNNFKFKAQYFRFR